MPEAPGLRTFAHPPARLLGAACRQIAAERAAELPDLTACVVLVPHLHARRDVAAALRGAAGLPALLLPRIVTLRAWADEVSLERPTLPSVAREALLYRALSARGWFDHADLWAVAAELSDLFDDLTRWHVGLPASLADFERMLDRAYRARAGASFAFEARLVHELWHAVGRDGTNLDAEAAYQVRLGRLAASVDVAAVYAIGLEALAPAEQQFLERSALRVPVVIFAADYRPMPEMSAPEHTLAAAWPEAPDFPLAGRAAALRLRYDRSPLAGRLAFFGAHGIEQEARAVDLAVRRWLHRGLRSVAVVVHDRLTARRARALLERGSVLVRDESGWAFSTTSAATVVSRWFDVCGNDFHHRDLLDLLKSPFAFADWDRSRRQGAVWALEHALRRENARTGLARYLSLPGVADSPDCCSLLLALQRAERAFERRRRKTLAGWLGALEASMGEIGVVVGLEADAAGMDLLRLLRQLAADLAADATLFGFGEFRRWMGRRLEAATFRDAGIDSPVIFTSAASIRLRSFDAVLVCGADDAHLAAAAQPAMFFNQTVRAELGLPGHAHAVRELEHAVFSALVAAPEVCVTWQHTRDGEPNLLAPLFERLRAIHVLAWDDALADDALGQALRAVVATGETPGQAVRPAPTVPPGALPAAISASAYNALMTCPYQFFAQQVLRLRELDEVQEEIEKSDYGNIVHAILHRFHAECPAVSGMSVEEACAALVGVSRRQFEAAIGMSHLARGWLIRWEKLVPQYVAWQRDREAQGWRFRAGEADRIVTIDTPGGRRFELRGRIDRVDERADGTVALVDYKTQTALALRRKVGVPGEDVQLHAYRLLWGEDAGEALYLSLDSQGVRGIEPPGDFPGVSEQVRERLARLLDRIAEGDPLPAQGTQSACTYCRVGGLCRRKHWS